ncbi:MAG: hypothetical protein AAF411_27425 [Myxococcota bacterium]
MGFRGIVLLLAFGCGSAPPPSAEEPREPTEAEVAARQQALQLQSHVARLEAQLRRQEAQIAALEAVIAEAQPGEIAPCSGAAPRVPAGSRVPPTVASPPPRPDEVENAWGAVVHFRPNEAPLLREDEARASMLLERRQADIAACRMAHGNRPRVLRQFQNPCIDAIVSALDSDNTYHWIVVWENDEPSDFFALRQDRTRLTGSSRRRANRRVNRRVNRRPRSELTSPWTP